MKKRTVKLSIEHTMPTNDRHCCGCPALGERFCNHLKVPLRSEDLVGVEDRILCHRDKNCPFVPPTCRICGEELNIIQQGKEYLLNHTCIGNVEVLVGGPSTEECIIEYDRYLAAIGKHFRQR